MKYLKQYGVENLKPGDILIINNAIVVFLDYRTENLQGWREHTKHLIRFKHVFNVYYGQMYDIKGYTGRHSFKLTRYEYFIDAIIKLDDEMLPKEFIETRDKIMENPELQKKLFKWSLSKS
jgi:hypothetical protein